MTSAEKTSLDPERNWLTIECSNGHQLTVQDHEGGSRAHCTECDELVDYGGYVHPDPAEIANAASMASILAIARAAEEAGAAAPAPADREIIAHDTAASSDISA